MKVDCTRLANIKKYFSTATLPIGDCKINEYMIITDLKQCVANHLYMIENSDNEKEQETFIERLNMIKEYLKNNK